jgi:hypothetical protein
MENTRDRFLVLSHTSANYEYKLMIKLWTEHHNTTQSHFFHHDQLKALLHHTSDIIIQSSCKSYIVHFKPYLQKTEEHQSLINLITLFQIYIPHGNCISKLANTYICDGIHLYQNIYHNISLWNVNSDCRFKLCKKKKKKKKEISLFIIFQIGTRRLNI